MIKACQILGVMVAAGLCIFTDSATVCNDDAGCTHGQVCSKASDCTQGYCACAANWRANAEGNCVEATALLSKDDTCSPDSKTDVCDAYDHISCSECPENSSTWKCRSGSTSLQISIITALSPVIIALFI